MSFPEAFVASRVGETRAAVMEGGALLEMHVARAGDGLAPGARVGARLTGEGTAEAMGEPLVVREAPAGLAQGALVEVEIMRAAIPERQRRKPARGRWRGPGARDGLLMPAPDFRARMHARGLKVAERWPEAVDAAWSEAWDEAELGAIAIEGGRLSLVPTPAGVAIDIDGEGPGLAATAARAIGAAVRRLGLGGSLLVDFPSLPRHERTAAAAAIDQALAGLAFERTAINGFGLMQIVRPRHGPSILERAWLERDATLALDLLEAAVREPRPGPLRLVAPAGAAGFLARHPTLVAEAARAAGRPLDVSALPRAGSGHVEPA